MSKRSVLCLAFQLAAEMRNFCYMNFHRGIEFLSDDDDHFTLSYSRNRKNTVRNVCGYIIYNTILYIYVVYSDILMVSDFVSWLHI